MDFAWDFWGKVPLDMKVVGGKEWEKGGGGGVREREMEAESKKGLQFLTYLQKWQDLDIVLMYYSLGSLLKFCHADFFSWNGNLFFS